LGAASIRGGPRRGVDGEERKGKKRTKVYSTESFLSDQRVIMGEKLRWGRGRERLPSNFKG